MEYSLSVRAIQHRWTLFFITLVVSLIAGYGMKYFQFDGSPKAFVDDDNQGLTLLLALEESFGRTNNAVLLIGPKDESLAHSGNGFMFQREQLKVLGEFTEKAWLLPHAQRVDSIINYQHTWGADDELYVESLLEDLDTKSDADLKKAQAILTSEASVVKRILTADGNYAGVIIKFRIAEGDQDTANNAARAVYALVDALEQSYPKIDIHPSGTIINNFVTMELAMTDTGTVVGAMYLAMFFLLALLLRSFVAMAAIVFVTMISVIAGVGIACWGGAVFTALSMSSISIIITVTIAHCVHIFLGFFHYYSYHDGHNDSPNTSKEAALLESLKINLQPVFLTSLTTVVGFLSMNLSEMPPMRDLGNICAAGVFVSFFCSYTMLPALIHALPFSRKERLEGKGFDRLMGHFAEFVIRRRVLLLSLCILVSAGSIYLAFENVINSKMAEAIKRPHHIRDSNDMVDKHLGGIYNIQFQMPAKPGLRITEPEYLQNLAHFAAFLRTQPEVTNVFSFSDVIKRLNKNLHDDDEAFYRIPESSELAAQYLLLYEMSLPLGIDLSNQVATDKESTRLVVTFVNMDTSGVVEFRQRIESWQQDNLPEYMRYVGTSYTTIWTELIKDALRFSIEGAMLALLLISMIMMVVFRSVKYGLISLIPNLLPAAIGFGFWKLYSGELNFGLMMVLTITIGIVVDDTVHFMTKYKRALETTAKTPADAVRFAFAHVGPALFITTLVLVTGFGILTTSQFVDNSTQGLLICVVLAAALLLDFLMLPPLLLLLTSKAKSEAVEAGGYNDLADNQTLGLFRRLLQDRKGFAGQTLALAPVDDSGQAEIKAFDQTIDIKKTELQNTTDHKPEDLPEKQAS
jgi:hypothetical protein